MFAIVSLAGLASLSATLSLISKAPYVFASNDWDTLVWMVLVPMRLVLEISPPIISWLLYVGHSRHGFVSLTDILQNGTSRTVSDITPASGWTISGCDANLPDAQTIRLTCDPSGANAANCVHILSSNPVNKVVRLPDSCGADPFARVAAWSNSTAAKRDGVVVQTCSFDYNFTQVPASYVSRHSTLLYAKILSIP